MEADGYAPLMASYDKVVDVLHIGLGQPEPAEGEGKCGGIEFRFTFSDGRPCGAAVIGFRRHGWPEKIDSLSGLIADHLGVSSHDVRNAIARATRSRVRSKYHEQH